MIARALAAALLSLSLVPQSELRPEAKALPESRDPYEEHIFFAVLEGLYQDGLPTEIVDRILAIDEQTKYPANFVWACPACMPAYNAFRVYQARPGFLGDKSQRDTFGPGLAPEMNERLTAVDLAVSQKALEELIETWMNRRIEALRLTEAERTEWRIVMEERRKVGMTYLEGYRKNLGGSYASMKTCPICEGAN